MGRHGVVPRRRRWVLAAAVVAAAATVLSVGVVRWSGGGGQAVAGPVCGGDPLRLRIGADAAVTPWLSELVSAYTLLHRTVDGRCVAPEVATVAGPGGVDVWVPESTGTVGLARMRPGGAAALAVPAPSIASSPIVLGLPRDAVQLLGRRLAGRTPGLVDLLALARDPAGWGRLATGERSWGPVRFSTPDPGTTTLGASLVVAAVAGLTGVPPRDLGSSGFGRVDTRDNLLGFTRTLISSPASARELLDTARASATTADLLRRVGIVAVHERDLWDYAGHNPAVPLQAVYPLGGQLAADVPFVVPAPVGGPARAAAADLLGWLRSAETQARLDRYGLRGHDGTAGPGLSEDRGVDRRAQVAPQPARTPDGYAGAQAAWTLITRPTSTLTVLDVSGSMADRVPGTASTKLDLARAAGTASLEFAAPRDSIGLWEFSTRLSGRQDHRVLVPLGPVAGPPDRRAAAARAYARLRPHTGTGLYDTVLAAYRDATARYRPDAVNTVVVISDGVNEDPGGPGQTALLTELRARFDPRRPVHVITLAYGTGADRPALARIAGVTRGLAFAAVDPRRLGEVFVAAVTAYRLKR